MEQFNISEQMMNGLFMPIPLKEPYFPIKHLLQ